MKIKKIKIETKGDFIKVSAVCKIRAVGTDEIYYKFDKKYKDFIKLDASPFASMLLVASMKRGEDLEINGEISEKLYIGMQEIVKTNVSSKMGLKPIKIKAKKLTKDAKRGKFQGVFFSGGVDSFYTYLRNKKKITHLIIVNGYDIDLRNKSLWEETRKNIYAIAKKENVEVIEIESNIKKILEPILPWSYFYGGCLTGIGLLLRNGLNTVYFASSYKIGAEIPRETYNTRVDANWGSENLAVVFDGEEIGRFEKVETISKEQVVLEHLRVCHLNVKGFYNCGVCDKCLRTTVALEIVGKLKDAKTFPVKIDLNALKNVKIEDNVATLFHKENLDELKKRGGNKELEKELELLLGNFKEEKIPYSLGLIKKLIYFDHMYSKGEVYKMYSKVISKY